MDVDCIDWVKTRWWKRLIRGIIGVAIMYGLDTGFEMIASLFNDWIGYFTWEMVIPKLVIPFLIYGPF
jgi:hypothetical protein